MRDLVRDDVDGAGGEVPALPGGGRSRRQPFSIEHQAVAVIDRIGEELGEGADAQREVLAAHGMHEGLHPPVRVVEAAAVEPLEVVVVGVARVDVCVGERAVEPDVVAVAADIGVARDDASVDHVDRTERVAAHVVGADRGRPQGVGQRERAAEAGDRDLLRIAEDAGGAADGALRLRVAVLEHHGARSCIDEVFADVAARGGANPPGQRVVARLARQHDELTGSRCPEPRSRQCLDRAARVDLDHGRTRVEIDVVIDDAEGRDGLTAPQLAGDVGAEHADAAVVLKRALDAPPGQQRVGTGVPHAQTALAHHARDAIVVRAQLRHRCGIDHLAPAASLRLEAVRPHEEHRETRADESRRQESGAHQLLPRWSSGAPSVRSKGTPASSASVGAMSAGVAGVS